MKPRTAGAASSASASARARLEPARPGASAAPAPATKPADTFENPALDLRGGAKRLWSDAARRLGNVLDETGLLRTSMDNLSGASGMRVGRSLDTSAEANYEHGQRR